MCSGKATLADCMCLCVYVCALPFFHGFFSHAVFYIIGACVCVLVYVLSECVCSDCEHLTINF